MTGEMIKTVLEDVCDNLFNPDPYYQQGGDMVRVGGLTYTCDPAEDGQPHHRHAPEGQALEAGKTYKVAGWAPVAEEEPGRAREAAQNQHARSCSACRATPASPEASIAQLPPFPTTFLPFAAPENPMTLRPLKLAAAAALAVALCPGPPPAWPRTSSSITSTTPPSRRSSGTAQHPQPPRHRPEGAHPRGDACVRGRLPDGRHEGPQREQRSPPPCRRSPARGVKFEVCEITLQNRNLKREQFIQEADFTPRAWCGSPSCRSRATAYIKP
jgi:hypothetical protein